jgi:hypothetical protein
MKEITLRPDLLAVASLIQPGEKVLDLGCGDGVLLRYLADTRQVTGRGVELTQEGVLTCVRRHRQLPELGPLALPVELPVFRAQPGNPRSAPAVGHFAARPPTDPARLRGILHSRWIPHHAPCLSTQQPSPARWPRGSFTHRDGDIRVKINRQQVNRQTDSKWKIPAISILFHYMGEFCELPAKARVSV